MYIVDSENKHAMSAIEKIKTNKAPGAVIELTAKEFEAVQNGVRVIPHESAPSNKANQDDDVTSLESLQDTRGNTDGSP